ncbi:cytochrome b [Lampropedia puyangensis]|uniref:Cytochrome b n=1 Tax=Lampropedia puyangensis TaxID=1330072 RepID=A0A4S8FES4_9BURK|nr:cytochrome b [Lampropedia puyangensis]THU04412.1 cytochrome b [Lampropedia puyangensis]
MHPQPPSRYSLTAILLHWLLAAAILFLFFFGLYMVDLPFSMQKLKYMNWHKWAGVLVLVLSIVRLATRLIKRPPPLPQRMAEAMPRWQHVAHHGTHHLMYLLFFAVPLLGWAYSSAAGFPIVLFGQLPLPDFVPASPELAQLIKPWHKLAAFALMGLIVLHVLAVVKHQFIDRDGLIGRMLP